jgi:hypothetical protein
MIDASFITSVGYNDIITIDTISFATNISLNDVS